MQFGIGAYTIIGEPERRDPTHHLSRVEDDNYYKNSGKPITKPYDYDPANTDKVIPGAVTYQLSGDEAT
jgi:hypothetical protein